jgi:hypothetical protein
METFDTAQGYAALVRLTGIDDLHAVLVDHTATFMIGATAEGFSATFGPCHLDRIDFDAINRGGNRYGTIDAEFKTVPDADGGQLSLTVRGSEYDGTATVIVYRGTRLVDTLTDADLNVLERV